MWDVVTGPFLAAAGLLVVAGVPKVLDPLPLVRALRTAELPVHRQLVRAFAAGEVLVGVWAVRRISVKRFYQLTYWLVFLLALKLIYDGAMGVFFTGATA